MHINYCDGDSFAGDRAEPLVFNGSKVFFRGKRIREAVLDTLFGDPARFGVADATEVLLGGCSAGGVSTYLHADQVRARVAAGAPQLTKYKAIGLSGVFPVTTPTIDGMMPYAAQIQSAFAVHNASGGVHQGCLAAASPGEEWLCNTAQGVYPHIASPFMLINSVYDAWSTACIFTSAAVPGNSLANGNCSVHPDWHRCVGPQMEGCTPRLPPGVPFDPGVVKYLFNGPRQCTAEQVQTLNTRWKAPITKLLTTSAGYTKPGNGAFMHTCHHHCSATMDGTLGLGKLSTPDAFHRIALNSTGTGQLATMQVAVRQWWHAADSAPAADNSYLPCTWATDGNHGKQCLPDCGGVG